ncbi:efflux RND transporter periplasmic adaptor subunit [Paragemmobacter straminiformis]|uniref:Efflux RND transporter periplasmic adaptor subunit n=1 Tax=Paragemmobacter straminiformis TaxID=2045119 RepID=A0A842I4Q0_9RHOB|nr:efflux RND transporter periplasmic adaptor subunit [Gemmobacter straminiformis]MBC2834589.1 efflux RND transporter periplasmic adaptor subunit [Gemmobacter straminiformis]
MTMRHLMTAGAIVAALALLVWVFRPAPVAVETARVTRGDLTVSIEAEGEARIREVVIVSAPITGLLQRITLHPGDRVEAGQSVAQIGPVSPALLDSRARAVAEATAAAAAAAVDLARSQLVQAEAMRDFARTEADRARALFDRATLSQRLLDDAILAERTATANAASAGANLSVREQELQSARAMLDSAADPAAACCIGVAAPVGGSILRVVTEDAQVVQAGTPIMELGNLEDLGIVAHVLSRDAVGIVEGAEATVTGWGGADLAARVDRIEPSAATRVSALGIEEQRVEVRLSLREAPPPALGHGFGVTARITVGQAKGIVTVPIAALFRLGGDWAVYTAEGGRAALHRVSLGLRNDDLAEVRDGLGEGDRVILHPADAISEGARIAP